MDVAGGAELEGAHIQILDSKGNVVEEWVSTKETHKIEGLKTGEEYTLRETVAPEGYAIATDTKFTIDETGKVTSTGTITEGGVLLVEDAKTSVSVSKVDVANGAELEGAHIQIINSLGVVVEEWDSTNTVHVVEGLKTGEEYTLRETVAPEGYTVATDTKFTIDETGKVTSTGTITEGGVLLVEDAKTSVSISKVDVAGGAELEGAHIQILDSKGNVVEEWVSTKETHKIEGLKTGEEYTLRETVTPEGYAIATDTTFTIDENGKVTSTGTITEGGVLLVEDARTSVSISKVDITNKEELEGALIQILDGDGNVVEEWTSTKEVHKVEGLKTGVTYTLHEKAAPADYDVAEDTTFVLKADGTIDTEMTTTRIDGDVLLVEDTPIPENGTIIIKKKGYVNEGCADSAQKTKPLKGVTFQLCNADQESGKETVSKTAVTDENGIATFTDLNPGLYEIRETATLDEYELDTSVYYARINEDGSCSGLLDSSKNPVGGNTIINRLLTADFMFVKVSESDPDKVLPGSTYGLYVVVEDGSRVLITTAVTDENGEVVFEGLLPGKKYEVEELEAPDGYYVSSNAVSFGYKITEDEGGEKKLEMDPSLFSNGNGTVYVDEAGVAHWLEPSIIVSFSKVDDAGRKLSGATLRIEDMEGNVVIPEWISTEEPFISEGQLVLGQTYRLVEVKAPEGYKVADPIKFTIPDDEVKPGENKVITLSMTDVKITKVVPPDTTVQTGDETPLLPYAMFTIFGFVGIVSTVTVKVKDRKKAKAGKK